MDAAIVQPNRPRNLNLGTPLSFTAIESGLRELNSDISFDAPVRRPSDYRYAFPNPKNEKRAGVYYNGKYICSVDRGVVPEFKVWNTRWDWVEIPMSDIERYDDTKVLWIEIKKEHPKYHNALLKAQQNDDNYAITEENRVVKYIGLRWTQVRDQITRLGWRHTFENLLDRKIPGINRESLNAKFGIDMDKYPVGDPEEVRAALFEE